MAEKELENPQPSDPWYYKVLLFLGVIAFVVINLWMCSTEINKGHDPNFYPWHTQWNKSTEKNVNNVIFLSTDLV